MRGRGKGGEEEGAPNVRVNMLRVWGCRAYHIVTNGCAKLDNKAVPLVFIGYNGNMAAYCLFNLATRKTVRSRNARFVEDKFPFAAATPGTVQSLPQPAPAPDGLIILASSQARSAANDATPQTPASTPPVVPCPPIQAAQAREVVVTPPPPRRVFHRASAPSPPSTEPVLPDEESRDELDFLVNNPFGATLAEVEALYSAAIEDLSASDEQFSLPKSDPRKHREAMRDTDSECWRLGEHDELTSIQNEYNVFHPVDRRLTPRSSGPALSTNAKRTRTAKSPATKLALSHKALPSGQTSTSARHLRPWSISPRSVSYSLSPPASAFMSIKPMSTRRTSMARLRRSCTCVYRKASNDGKVLKLDCMLYGLKQAGRFWNHRIHATLEGLSNQRTQSTPASTSAASGGTRTTLPSTLTTSYLSRHLHKIQRIKDGLERKYGIKDFGKARFNLGIQVHCLSNGRIFLPQRAYLEDVLLRLGYADGQTAPTPMQPNLQLAVTPDR